MSNQHLVDILVVGGGINGAGIAVDAAGRGLAVVLCEKGDLASGTSSASSKMIHGGLRYLEHYEFGLVRQALVERDILLKKAPHLIRPLQFVMPHNKRLRSLWWLSMGLYLYDVLTPNKLLPASRRIALQGHTAGIPLRENFSHGFIFSDCWVDDARLVVLNAISAAEHGARIMLHTELLSAERKNGLWDVTLVNKHTGKQFTLSCRVLVNATGPWVAEVLEKRLGISSRHKVTLVKGSHIVVPRITTGEYAYLLQHEDRRVIFVVPFEDFNIIGTTELLFEGDPGMAEISEEEQHYLCELANRYFRKSVSVENIVWSYSGVRPLLGDATSNLAATKITRGYLFDLNTANGQAPLLSIFGGKITTFRVLAEQAMEKLKPFFKHCGPAWTQKTPLPGGAMPEYNFGQFFTKFRQTHPWLPSKLATRYAHNYGTRAILIVQNARSVEDLGIHFAAGLYQREVEYLVAHEWAENVEDILWRRTKLGLFFKPEDIEKLENWLKEKYFSK